MNEKIAWKPEIDACYQRYFPEEDGIPLHSEAARVPGQGSRGRMMLVDMWWFNGGVTYRHYPLLMRLQSDRETRHRLANTGTNLWQWSSRFLTARINRLFTICELSY